MEGQGWVVPVSICFLAAALGMLAWEYRKYREGREGDAKVRGETALAIRDVVSELKLIRAECLTKEQHDEICDQRDAETTPRLESIQRGVDRMSGKIADLERTTGQRLTQLEIDIAIAKDRDNRRKSREHP